MARSVNHDTKFVSLEFLTSVDHRLLEVHADVLTIVGEEWRVVAIAAGGWLQCVRVGSASDPGPTQLADAWGGW